VELQLVRADQPPEIVVGQSDREQVPSALRASRELKQLLTHFDP
jgi:hypothetical protein